MTDNKVSDVEQRLFPRWDMGEQGAIRLRGASSSCTAIDISAGGVKVKTRARVDIDEEIELLLAGIIPLTARVVRVEPGWVAAAFTDGPQYLFR